MAQIRKVITKINRYLQEQVEYRYLKYLDYIGLDDLK